MPIASFPISGSSPIDLVLAHDPTPNDSVAANEVVRAARETPTANRRKQLFGSLATSDGAIPTHLAKSLGADARQEHACDDRCLIRPSQFDIQPLYTHCPCRRSPKIEPKSSQRKFAVLQKRTCIARVDFDLPCGFRGQIRFAGHRAQGFDLSFAKKPESNGPRH